MIGCNISQGVLQLARFMGNPSPQYQSHITRLGQYSFENLGKRLTYKKNHRHRNTFDKYGLYCAVDASFNDDYDTAKSTTGYLIFPAGVPVVSRSKFQPIVSSLTSEAEYIANFEASKNCTWIRIFLSEL